MHDPFESPRLLIDRARRHIAELEGEIKGFLDRKPYAKVIDHDPQRRANVHKLRFTERLPKTLGPIVFDIGSELRSALDQAVYAACVALGANKPKRTKFPFGDTAIDVENDIKRGCVDVPPEIKTFLARLQPHQGGNRLLWSLNKVRNTKNHQALVPVGIGTGGSALVAPVKITGGFAIGPPKWDPAKNEIELFTVFETATIEGELNVQFSFAVAFPNGDLLGGQPAVAVFNQLVGVVESIVSGLEAEVTRLIAARQT